MSSLPHDEASMSSTIDCYHQQQQQHQQYNGNGSLDSTVHFDSKSEKLNLNHFPPSSDQVWRYVKFGVLFLLAICIIGLVIGLVLVNSQVGQKETNPNIECGPEWVQYRDEKCFRILHESIDTFEGARQSCSALSPDSVLPVIHSRSEQDFLANYLFKTVKKEENFWLGARFDGDDYRWVNGPGLGEMTFTNWADKKNKSNYCALIRAGDQEPIGQWATELCDKRNFVVCERPQHWSVLALQQSLFKVRSDFEVFRTVTKQAYAQQLEQFRFSLIPIGFVYTQLPFMRPPQELWPWMTWTEVSDKYSDVFFRVTGSKSAPFGTMQSASSPVLDEVSSEPGDGGGQTMNDNYVISVPHDGWSGLIRTGTLNEGQSVNSIKFKLSKDEVRPVNLAIRLWTRTE